jgi:hypothetical protein
VLNALLGGWQFSGILTLRSGTPFTVTTSGGITNAGGADRPNRLADGTLPSEQRNVDHWFDLAAFKVQPQFTYGNSGRNILFGPGLRNIDLSLTKSFPLGETRRLQFRGVLQFHEHTRVRPAESQYQLAGRRSDHECGRTAAVAVRAKILDVTCPRAGGLCP